MTFIIQSIKADLYRLFRSKGFYIMLFILFALLTLNMTLKSMGAVGIMSEGNAPDRLDDIFTDIKDIPWTVYIALPAMLSQLSVILYVLIVIPAIIIGADFKNKTYKNIITTGISRTQYFVAKSITLFIVLFLTVLLYSTYVFVFAAITEGLGDGFTMTFLFDQIKVMMMKLFFIYATLMTGVSMMCLTKSRVAMTISIILLPTVVQLVMLLFNLTDTWVKYFDLSSAMGVVGYQSQTNIAPYFLAGSILIMLMSSISIFVFNKLEL